MPPDTPETIAIVHRQRMVCDACRKLYTVTWEDGSTPTCPRCDGPLVPGAWEDLLS